MRNKKKSATQMHEILSLELSGNDKDGWDVVAMYTTGEAVEIPIDATDAEALKLIRGELRQRKDARGYHSSSSMGHEWGFEFDCNRTGKPSYATVIQQPDVD